MALNKPATQISTHADGYGTHSASLANDGNRATDYSVLVNGCAASNREKYPWWVVDLVQPTVVCLVKLTNLQDANGTKLSILCVRFTDALSINRFVLKHTNLLTNDLTIHRLIISQSSNSWISVLM